MSPLNHVWTYFHQTEYWYAERGVIDISEIDPEYANSILEFLEERAHWIKVALHADLFEPLMAEYSDERLARKYDFGGPQEWNRLVEEYLSLDAETYVQSTPLYKAILARLR